MEAPETKFNNGRPSSVGAGPQNGDLVGIHPYPVPSVYWSVCVDVDNECDVCGPRSECLVVSEREPEYESGDARWSECLERE